MATFFQMMAKHPDVVKRAQLEIDSAIHNERLPTLDDRKNIPVVDCIMKEVFRYASLVIKNSRKVLIRTTVSMLQFLSASFLSSSAS